MTRLYAATTWSVTVDPDDPSCWYVSARPGPYAAQRHGDPQARIHRRRRLANGQLWQSGDRGDTWTALQLEGDSLDAIVALDHGTS